MSGLKDKIDNALQETRILMLVAQVVLGFELRAVFEPRFTELPASAQRLDLLAIGVVVFQITLLLTPAAFHRIVERGEDTPRLLRLVSVAAIPGLAPLVLAASVDVYLAACLVLGQGAAVLFGACSAVIGMVLLYGMELVLRVRRRAAILEKKQMANGERAEATDLKTKITHVLTEARVVLPGAQALLGFQFSIILSEAFARLAPGIQRLHLAALGFTTLTVMLLLTPAAYHRIVERGELTEHFHRFATVLIVCAMVPLALAISCDVYVVVHKVLESPRAALAAGLVAFTGMAVAWFGFTAWMRQRKLTFERAAGLGERRSSLG